MLYFAYGSNLDWAQMRQRCPSSRFVCRALLKNHRLAFTRTSRVAWEGHAVADVVPENGTDTWGVVYQISELEVGRLDRSEGYQVGRERNAYVRKEVCVLCEGDDENPMVASVYAVAHREESPPAPHRDYVRKIVDGANYWHLPEDYIETLSRIEGHS